MFNLDRYQLSEGVHRVKMKNVRYEENGYYEAIKFNVVNQSNGFRNITIFLNDKFLVHRLIELKYDINDIQNDDNTNENSVYQVDEKVFEGMIVYIHLVKNERGFIVLDDIISEKDFQNLN